MIEDGVAYSPLKMPNINAAVFPDLLYNHTAERTSSTTLNLSITVNLKMIEVISKKEHKLINGTSRFKFETDQGLTLDDIYIAFKKAFNNVYHALLNFLLQKGMPKMNIKFDSIENMTDSITPILKMFNETSYVPNNKH